MHEQRLAAIIPFLSAMVLLLDEAPLQWLVASHLDGDLLEPRAKAAVRMARQLLALSFFHEQTSASSHKQIDLINIHGLKFSHVPPLELPPVDEFFRKSLSLQQLARIEIRSLPSLVGTNHSSDACRAFSCPLPTQLCVAS